MLHKPVGARFSHQNSASAAQRPTRDSPPIDAGFAHAVGTPSPRGQSTAAHSLSCCAGQSARGISIKTRRAPDARIFRQSTRNSHTRSRNAIPRRQSTAAHDLTYCPSQQAQGFSIETRRAPDAGFTANRRGIRTRAVGTPSHGQSTAAHSLSCCTNRSVRGISIKTRERRTAPDARIHRQSTRNSHAPSERHPPQTIDRRAQPVMLCRPVSMRDFHRNSSSAAQRPTWDSSPIDAEFAHTLETPSPRGQSTAAHSLSCCTNQQARGISIETRRAPHSARRGIHRQSTRNSHTRSRNAIPRGQSTAAHGLTYHAGRQLR